VRLDINASASSTSPPPVPFRLFFTVGVVRILFSAMQYSKSAYCEAPFERQIDFLVSFFLDLPIRSRHCGTVAEMMMTCYRRELLVHSMVGEFYGGFLRKMRVINE
jgi:hypothetical protein